MEKFFSKHMLIDAQREIKFNHQYLGFPLKIESKHDQPINKTVDKKNT